MFLSITGRRSAAISCAAILYLNLSAPVHAIPSPELVIGSAASLGQLFALGTAAISGATFLGVKRGALGAKSARKLMLVMLGMFGLILALAAGNIAQYRMAANEKQSRLQATLTRPAVIQDTTLKETSLDAQAKSQLGISTDAAAAEIGTNTLFIDVRENAENVTGTIPGAVHKRFPDIAAQVATLPTDNVVLFCHNGNRSSETCARLAEMGIDCNFIVGGIEKWIVEGRPFTDPNVRGLSDLRAVPTYPGKDTLLDTADFKTELAQSDVQIVDVRYPGDFATGHLPGAINIPLRALPSDELSARLSALEDKPVIAACYDRRGCFISQVLGYELSKMGIGFKGRYTVPWEYFVPPAPKPHVAQWMAAQNQGLWSKAVGLLAFVLDLMAEKIGAVWTIFLFAVFARLSILPISMKAEQDQMKMAALKPKLAALKEKFRDDPAARSAMMARFNAENGLTPGRNALTLLFLPITMLGVAAIERDAQSWAATGFLSLPGAAIAFSVIAGLLGALYLQQALARTRRGIILSWVLGAPAVMGLSLALSGAAALYVCFALGLLLIQRAVMTGQVKRGHRLVRALLIQVWSNGIRMGALPLSAPGLLRHSGNKAFRLAILRRKGLPVPDGIVLTSETLARYPLASAAQRKRLVDWIVRSLKAKAFAVRSSAEGEDGENKSFAGVFDSQLDVPPDGMEDAIKAVLSSFSAQHTAAYDDGAGSANILIQPMISADRAGVLFTRAPHARGQMLVEYVDGAGEALVSGRARPKQAQFGRLSKEPMEGQFDVDFTPLLELGQQIEAVFGRPQDIEWVQCGGRFLIVQSRDITQEVTGDAAMIAAEWDRTLDRFLGATSDQNVLVQDESTEILPRPTQLSLDYMRALWAAGGSVDLACRSLGLRYQPPADTSPFLVRVFGRLYADMALKSGSGASFTKRAQRLFDQNPEDIAERYRDDFLPRLDARILRLQATEFAVLPGTALRHEIVALFDEFITEIHIEAERVNIAAGYFNELSRAACTKAGLNPTEYLAASGVAALVPASADATYDLTGAFAHRSLFDYELSEPRFREDPTGLDAISAALSADHTAQAPEVSDPALKRLIHNARYYQSLKEAAKHQTLRFLAELRRALLALDAKLALDGAVFNVSLDDLRDPSVDVGALVENARQRARERTLFLTQPALPANLKLPLVEAATDKRADRRSKGGALSGELVSGAGPVSGKAYVAGDTLAEQGAALDGFEDGDILVCPFLHPAWLPYLLRAGGVITETGGWLSHMAILARENDILLCVGVTGWRQIDTGQAVTVDADGKIHAGKGPLTGMDQGQGQIEPGIEEQPADGAQKLRSA